MTTTKTQPVFPRQSVRTEENPVRIHIPGGHDGPPAQITVNRVQGIIRSIDVVCACGQVTRLKCEYDNA